MTPREIWSNEAQERYVLAIAPGRLPEFRALCERERCPFAVVGIATDDDRLELRDPLFGNTPVDMELETLLGKPPRMTREVARVRPTAARRSTRTGSSSARPCGACCCIPTVADKTFLVTIGDRSVGGLCARDPMVGPWQVPVADCATTLLSFEGYAGEAFAIGERAPIAVIDAPASGRMAVGEALTNLAAAPVVSLSRVKLSANWMAAAGAPGEDAALFDTVSAVALELCPKLGVGIPVGKDSLSMRTTWEENGTAAGGARAAVARRLRLRALRRRARHLDAAAAQRPRPDRAAVPRPRLAAARGSAARSWRRFSARPGTRRPTWTTRSGSGRSSTALAELRAEGLVLAYHDRSDGGLLAALAEMAFAGARGARRGPLPLAGPRAAPPRVLATLFNEELGVVLQVRAAEREHLVAILARHGLGALPIGAPNQDDVVRVRCGDETLLLEPRSTLQRLWSETSWRMQTLRDNPESAREEYDRILDPLDPGLAPRLTFDPAENVALPFAAKGARPRLAVLREQGVNGHVEMAAAFDRAGFDAFDVHMSDLVAGRISLADFAGFVACGGFSYGDVLGGGEGWARSILFNARARDEFAAFFARPDSFALGVCNGCQMMSALAELVPGASDWPRFVKNRSEQFEARLVLVEIPKSPSLFFAGMEGSRIPVVTAHGEGRALFSHPARSPTARPGRDALRLQPRRADRALPGQPERLPAGHRRSHDRRRALHDPDAPPGARLPHGPDVLAPRRVGRGQPLDARSSATPAPGSASRERLPAHLLDASTDRARPC